MRNALKGVQDKLAARRSADVQETEKKEAGVSGIIELVIVLVILGILTAILLPTFLGTTQTAKNRSAESNLSTAVTDAQTFYANNSQSFTGNLNGSITSAEPGLTIATANTTAVTTSNVVTVQSVSGSQVVLGVYSPGYNNGQGGCIYASINNSGSTGTLAGGNPGVQYGANSGGCVTLATAPTGAAWQSTLP